MQARKLAYVEERSQAARNPQPKEKSHSRAEGSCSSTSVADPVINICFSSGQEWLYPGSELLVPVVQSISVQPLRREPWGIRLNPRLGALQLSQLKLFLP